ncbi:OmpA family protein [Luteimonas soli]|uniref:OmpA family protein n=1 Tax=Luteimonas soli TaxID=1648966 RepID=A0ABV7XMA9_9GAMM
MKLSARTAPLLILAVLLGGCQESAPADPAVDAGAPPAPVASAPAGSEEAIADAGAPGDATPAPAASGTPAFDIDAIPVSDAALGEFPYFSLPAGYEPMNKPVEMDYARFPFWTGQGFEWVEGRSYEASIDAADGKTWSEFELRKNLETLLTGVGAVKVTSSKIPREWTDKLEDDTTQGHIDGLGDIYNEAATVYVLRRADRNIWVHFVTNSAMGNWIIMETAPFEPTAKLIDASAMKRSLDATGKVALQVNFATDSTQVEPSSQPQVEQVVQLLQDDPSLQLSIDGHTDNTGDGQHNQVLSEGRAASVVAELVARGIDAARLQAQGYGDSQPVADNGTEAGRAQNRRVELVKR